MTGAVVLSREQHILTVTLNRPDRLNALTSSMMDDLAAAWLVASDPEVRAVVLTGAGRGFCSGVDRRLISREEAGGGLRLRSRYHAVMAMLATLEKPVVAAVNGPAAGAGLALAAAADLRTCAVSATFVGGFLDVGLAPDNGASFHLVRLVGYTQSLELLGLDSWTSGEALARGLVSEVVPDEHVLPRAQELAKRLALHPRAAMAATKRLLGEAVCNDLAAQLESEAAAYDVTSQDAECISRRLGFRESR